MKVICIDSSLTELTKGQLYTVTYFSINDDGKVYFWINERPYKANRFKAYEGW